MPSQSLFSNKNRNRLLIVRKHSEAMSLTSRDIELGLIRPIEIETENDEFDDPGELWDIEGIEEHEIEVNGSKQIVRSSEDLMAAIGVARGSGVVVSTWANDSLHHPTN